MNKRTHIAPLTIAQDWATGGHGVVLATVVETWGSAPRPVGSHMVVRDDGQFEGSVSGGCVEGAVIADAEAMLSNADAPCFKTLEFGVSNTDAWAVGLACGGKIRILLERMDAAYLDVLKSLNTARAQRQDVAMAHSLEGQTPILLDKPPYPESDEHRFINPHLPALRLYIVGAVHIAQALAPMAHEAGFDVTVIDPRGAFLNAERFQNIQRIEEWPDDALNAVQLDGMSALVTLTHDPKLDDAALQVALKSDVFYIGSLGSTRTHAARLKRLEALGFGHDDLGRIHGPVGLSIGAKSPAEIAVSILAELIQSFRIQGGRVRP